MIFLISFAFACDEKIDVNELKLGDKGIVVYPSNVVQVGKQPVEIRVVRILNEKSLYGNTFGKYYFVIVKDTKGIVDGKVFLLDYPVHVKETRRVGTRTVFVLERLKEKE